MVGTVTQKEDFLWQKKPNAAEAGPVSGRRITRSPNATRKTRWK